MKRRDAALALAVAAVAPLARAQGALAEGRHYARLAQPLPATPGKVEVLEFFMYTCPACDAFDAPLEAWAHRLPADVALRRVPVGAQARLKLHQRLFYALEAMGALTPAVHRGIFDAFHRHRVEANDEAAVVALAARLGVDRTRFRQAFASFGVQGRVVQAQQLAAQAGGDSVPALVVGGRWRTGPGMAGGAAQALAVADHLIGLSRRKG
jgi:thiol:disulfide interchange protein DsbA